MTMPPVALGMTLWVAGKLLLVGLLGFMHWGRQRLRSVPPPLCQRRTPVSGATRLFEGIWGIGAGYALCAAVYFASMLGQPVGTTLVLNPAEGGPAERAGLLPGDRARSVEGTPVKSFEEFRDAVARGPESVSIEVERNGRPASLRIRKSEDNRIGVAPVPGDPMGAGAALALAVPAPALAIAEWVSLTVRAFTGDVSIVGSAAVGAAVAGANSAWAHVLALLMTRDLVSVGCVYVVILVADARSRARLIGQVRQE